MNPLVSIIIPSFNAAAYILETVNSVLNQTYLNIEIIIVDNNSSDRTWQLLQQYKNSDSIILLKQPIKGASAARNLGLSNAKGEYMQFLDADDILHKDKIKTQIDLMLKLSLDLSYCKWAYFDHKLKNSDYYSRTKFFNEIISGTELLHSFGMDNYYMPLHCWLIKSSIIKKTDYWNESLTNNDDGEYFTRILLNASKVKGVPEILCYYRRVDKSLSKMNTRAKVNSAHKSYQIIKNHLLEHGDKRLLSYVKRMYYVQFTSIYYDFPDLALRAAKAFDSIKTKCFLNTHNRQLWFLAKLFGLYNAYRLSNRLKSILKN